jgi:signal peptidase I
METSAPAQPSWIRAVLVGRRPKRTLVRIVVLVATCFVVFKFVLLPIRVDGGSMLPTYKERGVNFVNRLAYVFHEPQRGDVVAIRLAGPSVMFMKRIVGMPGETVAFHGGHALINGKILEEPYVKFDCDWERAPVTLGPGQYFVVGDNRSMPIEDHEMGEPHRNRLVGKILL